MTEEKETPNSVCDCISRKLYRAEKDLHDVVKTEVPNLTKMAPECDQKIWLAANREMMRGLGHVLIAHAMMGDCRDKTFPDVEPQGGGT